MFVFDFDISLAWIYTLHLELYLWQLEDFAMIS